MGNYITKDKITSYAYENIYDVINTRTNVSDPRDPSNLQKRQFVYTSDPFETSLAFNLLPCIIVSDDSLEMTNVSTDGKYKFIEWEMPITIRTVKEGAGGTKSGVGYSDMLSIEDDLIETFNSETIKGQLRALNIYKCTLSKGSKIYPNVDGKILIEADYTLRFSTRLAVST